MQTPEEDAAALRLAVSAARAVAEHLHRQLVELADELARLDPQADRTILDALARDADTAEELSQRLEDVLRAIESTVVS